MISGKNIFWIVLFISSLSVGQDMKNISSGEEIKLFKPKFNLNIGSSFSYLPSIGSGMNMFAAPSFSMPLSKRIFMEGGIIVSTNTLPGLPSYETNFPARNFSSLAIYGTSLYQLSPRLTIYGSAIRQLVNTKLPFPYSPMNQNSFSIGSILRLGNNITVGASVNMSDNRYFYSPFPYIPAGLKSSPFNW